MIDYKKLNKEDRFLWKDRMCRIGGIYTYDTNRDGKVYNVQVTAYFEDDGGHSTKHIYLENLKYVYDSRIRLRDLVDVRREDGIVLRGIVVEIKPDEDRPYAVSGNGALVWMAAHEFERFVRADAPERAYETLTAVRARISVLEAELTALKLTEEVLEGVYGV